MRRDESSDAHRQTRKTELCSGGDDPVDPHSHSNVGGGDIQVTQDCLDWTPEGDGALGAIWTEQSARQQRKANTVTRQTDPAGIRPMTTCRERAKPGELYRSGLLVAPTRWLGEVGRTLTGRCLLLAAWAARPVSIVRLQPRAHANLSNLVLAKPAPARTPRPLPSSATLLFYLVRKKKSPAAKMEPGLGRRRWIGRPTVAAALALPNDISFTCSIKVILAPCAGLQSHIRLHSNTTRYYQPVQSGSCLHTMLVTSFCKFLGHPHLGLERRARHWGPVSSFLRGVVSE
ncbi:hypothetical protein B0T14DRAFT_311531 [Immersiella caudata]|uniref:Uncharacterized protein n=1 Tax=Immersiella caudata TaxID=314043 RepID=A0AA40BUY9_9PEZI|nr:hypothetical protein B0T14DRAFT_311531 [Immersiella caudata]